MSDLRRVLIRAALDLSFRAQLLRQPKQALADYQLSPAERQALRRRDASLLPLLAKIVLPPSPSPGPDSSDEPDSSELVASTKAPAVPQLPPAAPEQPEVLLRLELLPHAQRVEGALRVGYAARITPFDPAPATSTATPIDLAPAVAAVREAPPGARLPALRRLLDQLLTAP